MSFDTGGTTWTPETADLHAQSILAAMNALLSAQGLPTVAATPANALWLFMLAVGSKEQTQDDDLSAAINSFNLALCSDQQILNLLPIAGTSLISGAYTLVNLKVTAGAGAVVVPSGTILPYGSVNFLTTSGISLTTSGVGFVDAQCDTLGAIVVPASGLTAFGVGIPNLSSVFNPIAGITGRDTETATQARQRLILGQTIGFNLNGVQTALEGIPGITAVKVWFNIDTVNDLVLTGGIIVPPRHCRIIVAGSDTSGTMIASNYLERITCPTDGASFQTYTFLSGQVFDVFYDTAVTQAVYAKVYYDVDQPTQSGFQTLITEILQGLTFGIGQTISSETIIEALVGFQYASIIGATVSLDGITYSNKVSINGNAVPGIGTVTVVSG